MNAEETWKESEQKKIHSLPESYITTAKSSLPWKSGRHVEQEASPLLSLMELPDPSRSISTSTHEPETKQKQKTFTITADIIALNLV